MNQVQLEDLLGKKLNQKNEVEVAFTLETDLTG